MKSFLKTLIFSLCLLAANQSVSAQRWGIEAGYTMTGLQQSHNGVSGKFSLLSGCYLGPRMDYNLLGAESKSKLMLGGALLFEMRAGRYSIDWYKAGTTSTPMLYYGILPIDLTFQQSIEKAKGLSYFVFLGPRLNVGIFGSINEHYYLATRDQTNDWRPFEGARNRFDAGVGVGAGLQYYWFSLKLGYEFPFTNSSGSEPSVLKQHQFKFSIGYSFDEKKRK